ncbi:MAG: formylglycine-generating enzyme family protein, partial [Kiritimatiellae bacterium]|nr:formylglycine-generating enzyme family protein [Kiritimatiellia bacterium]
MKHLAKSLTLAALAALAAAAQAADPVPYLDPVNHTTNTCTAYTLYTGQTTLTSGWYVVSGDITNDTRIAVSGDVHLILADGASLTANAGVNVASNECFTIWAQSDGADMGRLTAQGSLSAAGIGGGSGETAGRVAINGGTVNATGRFGGAGIGGGSCGTGGTVTVNGGAVTATGIGGGAGIGGGTYGAGGMVTVNGGAITAIAGEITFIEVSSGIDIDVEVEISGPKAIGNGVFLFDATITIPIDEGGLVFPGTYCAYSPETATEPVDATKRMDACRGDRVKLTRCDPHGAAYRNNGADHTAYCPYCGAEGATEPHAFVNGVCACGALEPGVTDVRAESGAPGSGTVTISFNVTNSPAAVCPGWNAPVLSIVATDHLTGSNYVSDATALSARAPYQLADALAGSNGPHEVTWDFTAQGIDFSSTNVTFTVAYIRPFDVPGDYCVIDLSGGTNAAHYAVSYLDAEPEGGFTNDLYRTTKLAMRLLAPGTFQMGVDGSNPDNPSHTVTLTQPFYCAVFETTQRQWELVKGGNPSYYKGDTRPVEQVSWNMICSDSDNFLGVLRSKTGLDSLDLPTEAQWEYACRAGTETKYCCADSEIGNYAWYSTGVTHEVGAKRPNAWGLYDMHGNVWEWCLDWSNFSSLSAFAVTNPLSSSGSGRVFRGGSWNSIASRCTSSSRNYINPSSAYLNRGFRLVRTLSDNLEGERSAEAAAGAERAGTVCAGTSAPIAVGMREFADGDIRLTAYDAPYDGQPHTIGVETNEAIAGLELKFCAIEAATGGTFDIRQSTSAPPEYTNVCDMVVYVEASAPGYFTKTNSAAVRITPRSIADATIATIPVQYYEGAPLTPAVSVLCGGRQLAVGVDFDADYTANDAPGTGTVTLTGKGNYTNETSATFQILAAPRSLAVTAGSWGRVAVVVDGATNWIAAGAADVPVGYGSS